MPKSSIIVCSYAADVSLLPTIDALAGQTSRKGDPEIVIVTQKPAASFATVKSRFATSARVRIIEDSGVGLSRARNEGIRNSTGDILAFVDDSAIPEAGWLEAMENAFDENECDCVGGAIIPRWEVPPPPWFRPEFEESIGGKLIRDRGRLIFPETPHGGNIAFRRTTFAKYGLFDTRLGRTPDSLLSNEEVELCHRIYAGGGKILFEPSARVDHQVPRSRMTKRYARRRQYWQGVSRVRTCRALAQPPPPLAGIVFSMVWFSFQSILHVFDARERVLAECLALMNVGAFLEEFNLRQGGPNLAFPRMETPQSVRAKLSPRS